MGPTSQKPLKLHSPLLDGPTGITNQKYNQKTEEILDLTLFKKDKKEKPNKTKIISFNAIESFETLIKIGLCFIIAIGGMLSILELANIVINIRAENYNIGNNIMVFVFASVFTLISSIISTGIIHLIKTIKAIYLKLEKQSKQMDFLLNNLTKTR